MHVIEVENREILRAIQCEGPLREEMQKQGSATSFKDSRAVVKTVSFVFRSTAEDSRQFCLAPRL
jgi:hypothetical protein